MGCAGLLFIASGPALPGSGGGQGGERGEAALQSLAFTVWDSVSRSQSRHRVSSVLTRLVILVRVPTLSNLLLTLLLLLLSSTLACQRHAYAAGVRRGLQELGSSL